jgi:hypothetical protein
MSKGPDDGAEADRRPRLPPDDRFRAVLDIAETTAFTSGAAKSESPLPRPRCRTRLQAA